MSNTVTVTVHKITQNGLQFIKKTLNFFHDDSNASENYNEITFITHNIGRNSKA